MKIDQVMIGSMLNDHQVGLYSAAVKLSEAWYFVPVIISSSIFPSLVRDREINKKRYIHKLQNISNSFTIVSVSFALVITIFSSLIIKSIYGHKFFPAAPVLAIHIWSGVFVFLGVICSKYLILQKLLMVYILFPD